jgi:hypothetical protein
LVYQIGGRRAGHAADLAFLMASGDSTALEAPACTLGRYWGHPACEKLVRLCEHPGDHVRRERAMSVLRRMGMAGAALLMQFADDPVMADVVAQQGATGRYPRQIAGSARPQGADLQAVY